MHGQLRVNQLTGPWLSGWLGAALGFVVARGFAPQLHTDPWTAHVFGFGCVVAATLAVGRFVPAPPGRGWFLGTLAAAVLVIGGVYLSGSTCWLGALSIFAALLAAGSMLGAFVGARIEQPGHLLFVAIASSLADTFSVTQPEGPSHAIVQSQVALSLVALSWPMLGTPEIEPFLGVGDVVFTALYLAAVRRHGLPLRRSVLSLALAFFVTMLVVIAFQAAVPALPFLGAAMLIAHPQAWRVPERDRRRGFIALSVMAAVFLALLLRRG